MLRSLIVTTLLLSIALAGYTDDCWSKCGGKAGQCDECGGTYGWCCKDGSTAGGCNGFNGCSGYHCCKLGDCWAPCGNKAGACEACGANQACCKKGDSRGGFACNNGQGGCSNGFCCDKVYCLDGGIDDGWDVYSIVYDVASSQLHEYAPKQAGEQHVNNLGGSIVQSSTFDATETYTETKSFTHTAGASVTVGTEFKVGVPLIASGSVSVEVSASYEFSYGQEMSEEKSITASYGCNAPPGKYVKCTVTYSEFKATVPYTAVMQRRDHPECKYTIEGIFEEVSAFRMHNHIEERDHAFRLVKRTIVPLDFEVRNVE